MERLLSIDLKADFGMLKKPDTNEPVYLTYNMLHKPALLGILGAIGGYSGFKKKGVLPEYLEKLSNLKVGILPLENYHEKGNFSKMVITYNNSTGLASDETGGNWMVSEQTLIAPAFRCYLLLDDKQENHKILLNRLVNYQAEYLPYLGKNECSVWWDQTTEYGFNIYNPTGSFRINSLFIKEASLKDGTLKSFFKPGSGVYNKEAFMYFENLPLKYLDAPLFQYDLRGFAFTSFELKQDYQLPKEYPLIQLENGDIIQIF